MDYYKSEDIRKEEKPEKPRQKKRHSLLWAGIVLVLGVVLAGALVFYGPWQGTKWSRLRDTMRSLVPGAAPAFYHVEIEKNGKEFVLTEKDLFEITYRDEFVVKKVSTSSLFGWGLSVDLEGLTDGPVVNILFKGRDLVDKVMKEEGNNRGSERIYPLRVRYRGEVLAALPVKVEITPQDWVRAAKETRSEASRIESLKRASEMNHADPSVHRMLAKAYLREGRYERAAQEYQKVLKQRPEDLSALADLAKMDLDRKKYREAVELYGRIIRINPRDAAAHANMAYAHGALGNWEAARSSYQESLKWGADSATIRYHLAEAYEKTGKYSQAADQYRLALKTKPGDAAILNAWGVSSLKAGKYDEAIRIYSELLRKNSRDAAAHANLGLAYGGKGQVREEIASYKRSLKLNAKNATVHFNLAGAYERLKMTGDAAREYEKALRLGAKDPQIHYNLAQAYDKLGQRRKAAVEYEKYAAVHPTPDVLQALAGLYLKMNQWNGAIRSYERMLKLTPKKASLYVDLGRVYGLKGNVDQEIGHYRTALRYDRENEGAHLLLGAAYEKKRMWKEALEEYRSAYHLNPESGKAARKIPQLKIKILQQKHKEH